jgi:hypothetical protein
MMKTAAPVVLSQSNYLQVTIDIPTAQTARFASLMKKLLPTFTSPVPINPARDLTFGWTLVAALRAAQRGTTRITHLWQIDPIKPWMSDVMAECGTNKTYAALDLLVNREEQNYLRSNDHYLAAGATWPARLPHACAIETLQVTRSPAKLGDFEVGANLLGNSGMAELAARATQTHGWTLLLPLTPVSGLLRQFVHFWAIDAKGTQNVATVRRWLLKQPEYREGVEASSITAATPFVYARSPRG